ncbi:MAG: penicillin-binding protein activator LpoB [Endomicrobium sp.]|jgi:uncharacterized protein (TIGR02722 family)|nr:penicillin-binding protein activator LpoB [Endomicrobium sp.]
MTLKKIAAYFTTILFSVGLIACSCPQVLRIDSNDEIDLSGYWNDTDSQHVAQSMIDDSFANQWIADYTKASGIKPRVIIGEVLNKTEEHISTETFIKDLERSYLSSSKVTFVASKNQRAEIRAEKIDQLLNAKMGTTKRHGMETAADFMLKGQINSIVDANKKKQLKYYQIELELIKLETNEIIWMGQKKIKKIISRKLYKA